MHHMMLRVFGGCGSRVQGPGWLWHRGSRTGWLWHRGSRTGWLWHRGSRTRRFRPTMPRSRAREREREREREEERERDRARGREGEREKDRAQERGERKRTEGVGCGVALVRALVSVMSRACLTYRGTSFIRNTHLLVPYSSICLGPYGGPRGGGLFLISEVPLYHQPSRFDQSIEIKRLEHFDRFPPIGSNQSTDVQRQERPCMHSTHAERAEQAALGCCKTLQSGYA